MLKNRYQLGERLGQGGMGEVFAAQDRLTGQQVALKRVALLDDAEQSEPTPISPETRRDAGHPSPTITHKEGPSRYRLALAQEFRTLASLRHPNIIGVLDYGFDEERQPYYTMELLPAPQNILEAGRGTSQETRLRLLAQLVRALAYLHRHGIIHRDLKPGEGSATISHR